MSAPITSFVLERLHNIGQFRSKQLNVLRKIQSISKITPASFTAHEKEVDNEKTTKARKKITGSVRKHVTRIPLALQNAATVVIDKYPVTDLVAHSEKLRIFLKERKHKITQEEFNFAVDKRMKALRNQDELSGQWNKDDRYEERLRIRAIKRTESSIDWFPMRYDGPKVIQYLAARLCGDYSSIYSCLKEISVRDRDFRPKSMLDFGSGLGTSIWAINELWKRVEEFYCIDHSNDMNTVARLLFQDGKEDGCMNKPVIFRNTLPSNIEFDLVISAYTLMEIESEQKRAKLIESLWKMTTNYLVIIEKGGESGFTLIHETRQHLLKLSKQSKEGHIFSPCPHHEPCPKLKEKNAPCYFAAKYTDLEQMENEVLETEYFSYIIFKVGPKPNIEEFPRIIDEPFKVKASTHCHLCCSDGKLCHAVITSLQHGQDLYRSSRSLAWGDMLPARVENLSESETNDVIPDNS